MSYEIINGRKCWRDPDTSALEDCGPGGLCHAVVGTVTQYNRGKKMLGDQFPDTKEGQRQLRERIAIAKANGHNPSRYDDYNGTVAQFPGDPRGFIPHDDPIGHMKRVCEEVGVSMDNSLLKHTAPKSDPTPSIPLAADLIQEEVDKRIKVNPGLADKDQSALREEVVETHGYKAP